MGECVCELSTDGVGGDDVFAREDGSVALGKVRGEWISPLVQANRGKLRSSAGRLGRKATKYDASRPEVAVY